MDTQQLVTSVGFPIALVIVLGIALGRGIRWTATEIVKPLLTTLSDRFVKFLDNMESALSAQTEILHGQTKILTEVKGDLKLVSEKLPAVVLALSQAAKSISESKT